MVANGRGESFVGRVSKGETYAMPSTGGDTDAVPHRIWGEAEALSCYSSSTEEDLDPSEVRQPLSLRGTSSLRDKSKRCLPADVQKHIATSVQHRSDSASESEDSCEADFVSSSKTAIKAPNVQDSSEAEGPSAKEDDTVEARGETAKADQGLRESRLAARAALLHSRRACTPCPFYMRAGGCWRADNCNYCHLYHPRSRPCKRTRDRCRQALIFLQLAPLGLADREYAIELQRQLMAEGPYMERLVRGQQRRFWQEMAANTVGDSVDCEGNLRGSASSSSHQASGGGGHVLHCQGTPKQGNAPMLPSGEPEYSTRLERSVSERTTYAQTTQQCTV